MSTDFLRNYIDIIKEAEQPRVQLDEGMLQDLKAKASAIMSELKKMPGIGKAYQQAKAFVPEIKKIFMSSKSGKDVMNGIKNLVDSKTGSNALAESSKSDFVGGAVGTIGGLSLVVYEMATGFFDVLVNLLLNDSGANQAAAIWFLGAPILIIIAGAFLLYNSHAKQQ